MTGRPALRVERKPPGGVGRRLVGFGEVGSVRQLLGTMRRTSARSRSGAMRGPPCGSGRSRTGSGSRAADVGRARHVAAAGHLARQAAVRLSGTGIADSSARRVGMARLGGELPAGAISTMRPRYITATRSAMCSTTAKSCAMNRYDIRSRAAGLSAGSRICAWMETSSAETGSSARSAPARAHARAMPMRCRWPPENSCGKRRPGRRAGRPCRSSRRRASLRARRPRDPWIASGSPRIWPTVMRGLRGEWVLEYICIRRRIFWMSRRQPQDVLAFELNTAPVESINRSTVRRGRLPHPLSPTSASVSPRLTSNDTPSTARTCRRSATPPGRGSWGSA